MVESTSIAMLTDKTIRMMDLFHFSTFSKHSKESEVLKIKALLVNSLSNVFRVTVIKMMNYSIFQHLALPCTTILTHKVQIMKSIRSANGRLKWNVGSSSFGNPRMSRGVGIIRDAGGILLSPSQQIMELVLIVWQRLKYEGWLISLFEVTAKIDGS